MGWLRVPSVVHFEGDAGMQICESFCVNAFS